MKYFASFSANGGLTYSKPYEYTNKKAAIRGIKTIVKGNHLQQPYNKSRYTVWDENNILVAYGSLNGNGWWSADIDEIDHSLNSVF